MMAMTQGDATDTILKHAGLPQPGSGYGGLLARLRPFAGLDDDDFLELLEAVAAVAPHLASESPLDRRLVAALWDICRTARFWSRGGPAARSGQFIPAPVRRRLDVWVDELERIVLELLHGEPPWWAFLNTAWLSVRNEYGPRAGFLVPVWADALTAMLGDEGESAADAAPQASDMRVVCEAILQSGPAAPQAAGALAEVVRRTRFLPVRRTAARALKVADPLRG